MGTALNASRDTTSRKDNVSSLTSITPSQLMQDAEPGIGITKSVLPALINGSSMLTEYVFQFLINAKLMMQVETAPNASKDMT